MASNKIFNSVREEERWVFHIDEMFGELDLTHLNNFPVCIYHVPKYLSSANPEAFVPQLVALGPYHHFRPELYPMERFKLTAAKRVLDHSPHNLTLNQLVDKLRSSAPLLRACFHKYIDLKDDTLMYIMAIDNLFLMDFLSNEKEEASFLMHHVVCMDAIIRDVMMLGNLIPTCMLRKILAV